MKNKHNEITDFTAASDDMLTDRMVKVGGRWQGRIFDTFLHDYQLISKECCCFS